MLQCSFRYRPVSDTIGHWGASRRGSTASVELLNLGEKRDNMLSAIVVGAGAVNLSVGLISSLCSTRSDPLLQRHRDISMNITSDIGNVRCTTVSYVNLFDATTFGRTVHMTASEERRLRNVLAALNDYGFILRASFSFDSASGYGFADVIDHLRATISTPLADAALAAAERSVPAAEPAPAALMPVWEFEAEHGSEDVLLSSATLWNVNLLVEALRVEDDDDPVPVGGGSRALPALGRGGGLRPEAGDLAASRPRRELRHLRRGCAGLTAILE
jgi:hypothetical protein